MKRKDSVKKVEKIHMKRKTKYIYTYREEKNMEKKEREIGLLSEYKETMKEILKGW